ncbi:MAG: anacyclamide/piricyclamide family prenylated cyclic peptide [Cyanobacteria bacterium J007]|nr:MAG: anacyclamide/piricyclamide family prenylated cyclic peptide [Cyanobacteria bacterium J007]
MKTQKLTPANAAPVKRKNAAADPNNGNGIAASILNIPFGPITLPFAGDDAE